MVSNGDDKQFGEEFDGDEEEENANGSGNEGMDSANEDGQLLDSSAEYNNSPNNSNSEEEEEESPVIKEAEQNVKFRNKSTFKNFFCKFFYFSKNLQMFCGLFIFKHSKPVISVTVILKNVKNSTFFAKTISNFFLNVLFLRIFIYLICSQ